MIALALLVAGDADARPLHGTLAAGGSLLTIGNDDGGHWRLDGEVDVAWSRVGALVALRAADPDHAGLLTGGLTYELGAARPHLVLQVHGDLGWDLDRGDGVVGGGLRGTLGLVGPLALVLDAGAYLVWQPRVVLTTAAMLAIAW